MRASSTLKAVTPSANLLRFLRSQQQAICFLLPSSCSALPTTASRPVRRFDSPWRPRDGKVRDETCSPPHQQPTHLDLLSPRRNESNSRAFPLQSLGSLQHFNPPQLLGRQLRHASTETHSLFRRLFPFRNRRKTSNLDPSDLPPGQQFDDTSSQLFNLSRSVSRSTAGADLKLRCTELDSNGSVTLVSGEFKKSELIAKYGLLPRDLRKIDSSVLPHILVRPSAILINLLHLRVLIQSDRVLVFDAYGSTDSYTQSLFMYDLEGKLRQKADTRASGNGTHLAYELRALEAVLISVTSGLESEFEGVREPVVGVLRDLEEDIDREKLRHLLVHSKKLGTFEQKARLVRDAINDLLDADDDLAAMYLTERKVSGLPRNVNEHQEVEMLLESYHKICDEIVEISGNLIGNIRNTEEVVKAILDANRNSLMLLELKFSIGTLGLAAGTLVAGLYGMNLKNFLEESDFAFHTVSAFCFGFSAVIALYGMRKLRKLQKVRMWGEGYGAQMNSTRGNWRNEAIEQAGLRSLPGESRVQRMKRQRLERGPVLWPGMDGLGSNVGVSTSKPSLTIHDDIADVQSTVKKPNAEARSDLPRSVSLPATDPQAKP